jgi:dTDP-glucose 4,6-dehydratase
MRDNSEHFAMEIIVTGGAGFIGSALVRHLLERTDHEVFVIDKLTYAGNLASLDGVRGHRRFRSKKTTGLYRAANLVRRTGIAQQ